MATIITYPRVNQGATMRLVNTNVPSASFQTHSLTVASDDDWPLHVGLLRDCGGTYDLSGHCDIIHACPFEFVHGHIFIECEDGTGMVPAPIVSRAMIRKIFEVMIKKSSEAGGFTPLEVSAMEWIVLKDSEGLPEEFTADEVVFNTALASTYPLKTHTPSKQFTDILKMMEKGTSPYTVPFFEM